MTDTPRRFSYAAYEEAIRALEYETVRQVSRDTAAKFRECRRVLDIASGQGFLLEALQEIGIESIGVDNEPNLVAQCQRRGLTVFGEDAIAFLDMTAERFDGVNCAHFIEHLTFESVLDVVEGIRRVLLPGGRFVLRWPNPRSLEMQHISFWKDPAHVRFYDGQLIEAVLTFYGFEIVSTHYADAQPRVSAKMAVSQAVVPRTPRQKVAGAVRGWLLGPLRFTGVHRVMTARDNRLRPLSVLRLLTSVPLEAEIIAVRQADTTAKTD